MEGETSALILSVDLCDCAVRDGMPLGYFTEVMVVVDDGGSCAVVQQWPFEAESSIIKIHRVLLRTSVVGLQLHFYVTPHVKTRSMAFGQ